MTEESITGPVTPEIVVPDGVRSIRSEGKHSASKGGSAKQLDPLRASTGSIRNGGKKFTSGKLSSPSKGESSIPHYLRASTGSCHDFCKHGIRHEREVKPWQVIAKKVIKPKLNQQNESQSGDLSEKITEAVEPKPHSISKTTSLNSSAVSGKKLSSQSSDLAISSRPVSAKEKIITVNEKKKNVPEKRNSPKPILNQQSEFQSGDLSEQNVNKAVKFKRHSVSRTSSLNPSALSRNKISSSSNDLAITSESITTKEKIIAVNEKNKNVLEKRNSLVISGRRESETKPDKIKETSKEAMKKLVSVPAVHRASKPSLDRASTLGVNANRSKKIVRPLDDQSKIGKAGQKSLANNKSKEKTVRVIKVEAMSTVQDSREKNQEGIKEVENKPVENEKTNEETSSLLKVDPEKLVPELEENGSTCDPLLSESLLSSIITSPVGSPVLFYGGEVVQDEVDYINREEKVTEPTQNESIFGSPSSASSLSPNISSAFGSPAYGMEEAQDDLGYSDTGQEVPELKQNEISVDSSRSESFSASTQVNTAALLYGEKETRDVLDYINSENEVPESKLDESIIDFPPSESFTSLSLSSLHKSSAVSNAEEEVKDEAEYTNSNSKVPELKLDESTTDSPPYESFSSPNIPSLDKSSASSSAEEEVKDEIEYTNNKNKVLELKQNESTIDSYPSESVTSPNIPSLDKFPALSNSEEATDEVGYTESKKEVHESEQNEGTIDSPLSESFASLNMPSLYNSSALPNGEEEAEDDVEFTNCKEEVHESFSSPNIAFSLKASALSFNEDEAQVEYTNNEKKVLEFEQSESNVDSPPSESFISPNIASQDKSPVLSNEEEAMNEVKYTECKEKVPESKQIESTSDSAPSESLSPSNIISSIKSPVLSYGEEKTQDVLEYTIIEKKVFELEQKESTLDSTLSESFSSTNIPSAVKSPSLSYVDIEDYDEFVYLDSETDGSADSISESSETINSDEEETFIGNSDSKTRKPVPVSEENAPATKLKFRRGKVVEIESNNNGPRRLRFRKARILDENQDNGSNSRRKGYGKGGVVDDMDQTKDDSEKIVLRHQQVQGKKDGQGLFNNVIEETASKLAETRKSKVKALVGAFETVISLQENKPLTQTGSS